MLSMNNLPAALAAEIGDFHVACIGNTIPDADPTAKAVMFHDLQKNFMHVDVRTLLEEHGIDYEQATPAQLSAAAQELLTKRKTSQENLMTTTEKSAAERYADAMFEYLASMGIAPNFTREQALAGFAELLERYKGQYPNPEQFLKAMLTTFQGATDTLDVTLDDKIVRFWRTQYYKDTNGEVLTDTPETILAEFTEMANLKYGRQIPGDTNEQQTARKEALLDYFKELCGERGGNLFGTTQPRPEPVSTKLSPEQIARLRGIEQHPERGPDITTWRARLEEVAKGLDGPSSASR